MFLTLLTLARDMSHQTTNNQPQQQQHRCVCPEVPAVDPAKRVLDAVSEGMRRTQEAKEAADRHIRDMKKLEIEAEERRVAKQMELEKEKMYFEACMREEGANANDAFDKVKNMKERLKRLAKEEFELNKAREDFNSEKTWHTPKVVMYTVLGCVAVGLGLNFLDNNQRGKL